MAEIFARAVRALAGGPYTAEQLDVWASRAAHQGFERRIRAIDFLVAEGAGGVVGFGALDRQTGQVEYLYVDPTVARQGIGTLLYRELERMAARHGLASLWLVASLNALPFYEHLGFRTEQTLMRRLDGVDIPCLRMSRPLV